MDRVTLQDLANQPIGGKHLQEEAERKVHTEEKRSPELVATCKRASKIWLPEGKTPPRQRKAEPSAAQIDIEDAIEAAGGTRGSRAA